MTEVHCGGIEILGVTPDVRALAAALMEELAVPSTEPRDALHVSLAAVNAVKSLVTSNFKHIANAETRATIENVIRRLGFIPPVICSPDELLGG